MSVTCIDGFDGLSVMLANNEIGTIQPIAELAQAVGQALVGEGEAVHHGVE
mgnify:CR=1 FL=1